MGNVAFAGLIDLIQQLEEALALDFRHRFANSFSNEITLAKQTDIEFVDELEYMIGST